MSLKLVSLPVRRLTNLQELQLGMQKQAVAAEIGFPVGVFACRCGKEHAVLRVLGRELHPDMPVLLPEGPACT